MLDDALKEINLPLLAEPIRDLEPAVFYERILGLYEPRTSSGKIKELKPKGKVLSNPTKSDKRPYGIFEVKFQTALGLKSCELQFDREKRIKQSDVNAAAEAILCSTELLTCFLTDTKGFTLC